MDTGSGMTEEIKLIVDGSELEAAVSELVALRKARPELSRKSLRALTELLRLSIYCISGEGECGVHFKVADLFRKGLESAAAENPEVALAQIIRRSQAQVILRANDHPALPEAQFDPHQKDDRSQSRGYSETESFGMPTPVVESSAVDSQTNSPRIQADLPSSETRSE